MTDSTFTGRIKAFMVMVNNRMNNPTPADTQPTRVTDPNEYQPIEVEELPRPRRGCGCGCLPLSLIVLIILLGYFLFPARSNILVLGVDRTPDGTALGRTDTNILVSVIPLKPTVNMLSIPRDLWVTLPARTPVRIPSTVSRRWPLPAAARAATISSACSTVNC